jgi:hypothetical protein
MREIRQSGSEGGVTQQCVIPTLSTIANWVQDQKSNHRDAESAEP